MKFKVNLLLLFVVLSFSALAQFSGVESISESELKAHLEFIASDYMQGRDFTSQTPGLEITADYLKAQCKLLGLKPGGDDYFQAVDIVSVLPDPANTFCQLKNESGEVIFETQDIYSLGGQAKSDTIEGEIVFAGYGWYNDKTKYNDTEGLDLKGKIVLVMTRTLEMASGDSISKGDINIEMRKMSKAIMGGAKALIMVPDPLNQDKKYLDQLKKYANSGSFKLKGAKARSRGPIRLVFGTEDLANEIVKESGKTLAQLQQEINESGKPNSFAIEKTRVNVQLAKSTLSVDGKNVVAIVEGSDPLLKNECIVFSAHYDHLGVDKDGEIYNGADDNGSGTVALLEIAEAFQSLKTKPKRSIVFVWVTAEEKGLMGSNFYSQHPIFPLENTLVDINIDMVGRSAETEAVKGDEISKQLAGPNGLYIISGKQSSELTGISDTVCKDLGLIPSDELTKPFLRRSDYYHFYKHGIPILGLSTGMHADYHKISDEIDKIDFTKMKRVAQYAFLVGYKVADQKQRIVVDNPVTE
jgi:hypothetical protein